jgi:hypothetical protein
MRRAGRDDLRRQIARTERLRRQTKRTCQRFPISNDQSESLGSLVHGNRGRASSGRFDDEWQHVLAQLFTKTGARVSQGQAAGRRKPPPCTQGATVGSEDFLSGRRERTKTPVCAWSRRWQEKRRLRLVEFASDPRKDGLVQGLRVRHDRYRFTAERHRSEHIDEGKADRRVVWRHEVPPFTCA